MAGPRAAGAEPPLPATPVLIGTEAVLHRVRRAAAVAFLDIDLHLLAPRLSATEETLALFVRAARLVGARGAGRPGPACRRRPGCPITRCSRRSRWASPTAVLAEEVAIRRTSAPAPLRRAGRGVGCARPRLRRVAAPRGRDRAGRRLAAAAAAVSVSPLGDDRFLLRADSHAPLCDLLARTPRPAGTGAPRRGRPGLALSPDRARPAPGPGSGIDGPAGKMGPCRASPSASTATPCSRSAPGKSTTSTARWPAWSTP